MTIDWNDNELYGKTAESCATNFIDIKNPKNSVSRHQFRRFFDEFKRLYKKSEEGDDFEKQILPLLKLQKAKIAYTCKRMKDKNKNSEKFYGEFEKFMKSAIDSVSNKEQFNKFILLNEAVYAYFYALGGSKEK